MAFDTHPAESGVATPTLEEHHGSEPAAHLPSPRRRVAPARTAMAVFMVAGSTAGVAVRSNHAEDALAGLVFASRVSSGTANSRRVP